MEYEVFGPSSGLDPTSVPVELLASETCSTPLPESAGKTSVSDTASEETSDSSSFHDDTSEETNSIKSTFAAGLSGLTAFVKDKKAAVQEHFTRQSDSKPAVSQETTAQQETIVQSETIIQPKAPVQQETIRHPETAETQKKNPKKRALIWIIIALSLLLLLALTIVLIILLKQENIPDETSPQENVIITDEPTEELTTESETTLATTTVTEQPTEATTEETTEAPTELSVEEFFEGVWQGSDANVTTIEIHRDHTLYYRELNNKKIKTVEGSRGTWTADDKKSIRISLPRLGNGYELEGIVHEDGSFLLKCLNGQPWSDEIVKRSSISLAEIDKIVDQRLKEMFEDGRYEFSLYGYAFSYEWEKPNEVLKITRKSDGRYFRVLPDRIETTLPFYDENYNEINSEGAKKVVSFARDCLYYYYELRERTDYYSSVRDMQNLITSYFDRGSYWLPVLYVREGEITTFAYEAY